MPRAALGGVGVTMLGGVIFVAGLAVEAVVLNFVLAALPLGVSELGIRIRVMAIADGAFVFEFVAAAAATRCGGWVARRGSRRRAKIGTRALCGVGGGAERCRPRRAVSGTGLHGGSVACGHWVGRLGGDARWDSLATARTRGQGGYVGRGPTGGSTARAGVAAADGSHCGSGGAGSRDRPCGADDGSSGEAGRGMAGGRRGRRRSYRHTRLPPGRPRTRLR
jgi:hypothetical protein